MLPSLAFHFQLILCVCTLLILAGAGRTLGDIFIMLRANIGTRTTGSMFAVQPVCVWVQMLPLDRRLCVLRMCKRKSLSNRLIQARLTNELNPSIIIVIILVGRRNRGAKAGSSHTVELPFDRCLSMFTVLSVRVSVCMCVVSCGCHRNLHRIINLFIVNRISLNRFPVMTITNAPSTMRQHRMTECGAINEMRKKVYRRVEWNREGEKMGNDRRRKKHRCCIRYRLLTSIYVSRRWLSSSGSLHPLRLRLALVSILIK